MQIKRLLVRKLLVAVSAFQVHFNLLMEISEIAEFDADIKLVLTQKLNYTHLSDVQ